jgi:AraC-like DNA-binding protein/mannose-6-phosphate isomerase-like protein (cupin superfamily)
MPSTKRGINMANYKYLETNNRSTIDLSVYHCGTEICTPSYSFGPAVRDHFIIHYILSGNGSFHIDGKVYNLKANQGFLICPDVATYYEADSENPWTYIWVGFFGVKAKSYLSHANLSRENPIFTYDNGDKENVLKDIVFKMLEYQKLNYANELRIQGLLFLFLSELVDIVRESPSVNETSKELYVKKCIQFVERNYSLTISISDLSEYVGLNRCYLSSLFKATLNTSPQEFLIRFRMNKACELMRNDSLSISDISRSVGYIDPFTFSRMFRSVIGQSPRQYRKNIVNVT